MLLAKVTPKTSEQQRLLKLMKIEKKARKEGFKTIAGIDEAGRGPLAGPVVAAACIIPEKVKIHFVNDSKQLTPLKRQRIYEEIISDSRILFGVGIVSHEEIDRINIYQATIQAMLQAVEHLKALPDLLLVDGMPILHPTALCRKIIKGDALVYCIAAASIIAKETRDRLMVNYHQRWPEYGFEQHKGYGTELHLRAIEKYGPCPIHRKTFAPFSKVTT